MRPAFIFMAVLPAVVSLTAPIPLWAGGIVRRLLISVLLVILVTRLLFTMLALSRAERVSRHRASHDPLTGLLNRGALDGALSNRLADDEGEGRYTAVLFIDCDDFKHVNDTWGHPAGDRLLRAIATGLPPLLGPGDVMARLGGDEFVVIASVADPEQARATAESILAFFETPLPVLDNRLHRMAPSIGVTVADPGGEPSAVALLEKADAALYEAKAQGRGRYVVFDAGLAEKGRMRAAISDALRLAIANGSIRVAFQPILTGPPYTRIGGWEALARWTDPQLGVVPPSEFVPLAEQHGLIEPLGEAVLRRACHDAVRLRAALGEDLTVSVNVSPVQLRNPHLADIVAEALADAGHGRRARPHRLPPRAGLAVRARRVPRGDSRRSAGRRHPSRHRAGRDDDHDHRSRSLQRQRQRVTLARRGVTEPFIDLVEPRPFRTWSSDEGPEAPARRRESRLQREVGAHVDLLRVNGCSGPSCSAASSSRPMLKAGHPS